MLVVRGERNVLDLLEVDGLQPLPIGAEEEVKIGRVNGAIPEHLDPVRLELVEPVEAKARVNEPAM